MYSKKKFKKSTILYLYMLSERLETQYFITIAYCMS